MGSWQIKYGLWHKVLIDHCDNSYIFWFFGVIGWFWSNLDGKCQSWVYSHSNVVSVLSISRIVTPSFWDPNIISCWDRRALSSSSPLSRNSILSRSIRRRGYYTLPYLEQLRDGWMRVRHGSCQGDGMVFLSSDHWQLPLSISRIVTLSFWSTPILSVVGRYPRIVGRYRLAVSCYRVITPKHKSTLSGLSGTSKISKIGLIIAKLCLF